MFSEKKVWGMEMYFVEREKGDFVLELTLWLGKEQGQTMATKSSRRFVKEEHWGKNFVCDKHVLSREGWSETGFGFSLKGFLKCYFWQTNWAEFPYL